MCKENPMTFKYALCNLKAMTFKFYFEVLLENKSFFNYSLKRVKFSMRQSFSMGCQSQTNRKSF